MPPPGLVDPHRAPLTPVMLAYALLICMKLSSTAILVMRLHAPSTRIILLLAVLKRKAFGPRYSSELYQRLACSRLGNSRTTTRLGCQSPSRVSVAPPRTTKRPPYC